MNKHEVHANRITVRFPLSESDKTINTNSDHMHRQIWTGARGRWQIAMV